MGRYRAVCLNWPKEEKGVTWPLGETIELINSIALSVNLSLKEWKTFQK